MYLGRIQYVKTLRRKGFGGAVRATEWCILHI